MDTKDLVNIKKQRIREELEKLVPPGFYLQPHPKVRKSEIYDQLDEFLGIDETLSRQVGYLNATDKEYNTAIQHLRFFGLKLKDYKDVVNTGPFYNAPELNKNLKEACDYMIRFYELAQITINRINDEEDVRLKLLQNQVEKEKQQQKQSQIEDKKSKAKSFVSSATSFRPGTKVNIRVTRSSGIIPKRAIPQQALDVISKKADVEPDDSQISGSRKLITDLGRVTLQIEQTNNNLNRVVEIIVEDIKNTKEQNRKEVEEYRKRTQDRSRKLGRRELGSSKVDVSGAVKKYVGSFFSGTGGAIRAVASFNLIEKLLEGDFLGAIGPLLGIGATYLPQIGAVVAGLIGKKLLKGMFGGGKTSNVTRKVPVTQSGGTKVPKLGKFGKLGLVAGGLSLGGALLGMGRGEDQSDQEQRLEQLTQEQKGLVAPEDIKPAAIPQSELRRFESLNQKFEAAIDFLMKKQREQETQRQRRSGGGNGGGGGGGGTPSLIPGDAPPEIKGLMDAISSTEGTWDSVNYGRGPGKIKGLENMTIDEALSASASYRSRYGGTGTLGRYQQHPDYLRGRAEDAGLDPSKDKFSQENQTKIQRVFMSNLYGGEQKLVEDVRAKRWKKITDKLGQDTGWPSLPGGSQSKSDYTPEMFGQKVERSMKVNTPPPTPTLPKPDAERSLKPDDKQKISFMSLPGMNSPDQKVALSSSDGTNKPISVSTGGGICKDFSDILQLSCQRIA